MKPKVELLSPAGSLEKLKFALTYGADAVYAGAKSFSLREGAANFTLEDLKAGVETAHSAGKKLFLAANIFFHNSHIQAFREFLEEIKTIPIDGMILSDLGVIHYVREKYPELAVHISTQANTTNAESARFYQKLGIKRIVLARELLLDEIKEIRAAVDLELETFVHGAMCISYSGRCLLSNYFTNLSVYRPGEKIGGMKKLKTRDANLGDCSQSCRWDYYLVESTRKNDLIPIEEGEHGTSILSSKDLNLSAHMRELIGAGINSFKIEGRMKSVYYAANVTRAYRYAIDRILSGEEADPCLLDELNKISHREYTTGFYFNENLALNPTKTSQYLRDYTFLGHVTEVLGKGKAKVHAMNQILLGKPLEVISTGMRNTLLTDYRLVKKDGPSGKVQPNEDFILEWDGPAELRVMDILRRE